MYYFNIQCSLTTFQAYLTFEVDIFLGAFNLKANNTAMLDITTTR